MLIATDIGGTFTDLVAFDPATGQLLHVTSHTDPPDCTVAIARCRDKAALDAPPAREFLHGSTFRHQCGNRAKGCAYGEPVGGGPPDGRSR